MNHPLLHKKIYPGAKVWEVLAWVCSDFIIISLLLVMVYIADLIEAPMNLYGFTVASYTNFLIRNLLLAPLWQLYFVRLKHVKPSRKVLFHLITITGYFFFYGFLMTYIMAEFKVMYFCVHHFLLNAYISAICYAYTFAIFHGYNLWLGKQQQQKKEQELRDVAFQTEIKALKAQIEPHFLFNTLNSISASVPPDQEKTRMLIANLADTFRFALQSSETETIALEEELQFIKTWLALEKHRLKEKLQVSYEIDSLCLNVLVPPMLLQPIVENALNHGIAEKIDGGAVHISCVQKEGFVHIAVSDTGIGYDGDLTELQTKGIGLKNIAKRLQLLYQQPLRIERNSGAGLSVSFQVPVS